MPAPAIDPEMKDPQEDRRQPGAPPSCEGGGKTLEARAVLEALPGAAVVFDGGGVLREGNRAAGALVGKTPEELAGLTREAWEALLARHYNAAAGPSGSERLESAGFPRLVWERESHPLPEPPGGRLELLRNVTADRRAEDAAQREEQRHARELEVLEAQLEQAQKFKMEL